MASVVHTREEADKAELLIAQIREILRTNPKRIRKLRLFEPDRQVSKEPKKAVPPTWIRRRQWPKSQADRFNGAIEWAFENHEGDQAREILCRRLERAHPEEGEME